MNPPDSTPKKIALLLSGAGVPDEEKETSYAAGDETAHGPAEGVPPESALPESIQPEEVPAAADRETITDLVVEEEVEQRALEERA
ncbi:hypothetical protein U1Q18_023279 [Sarracenia purpurea var. burkii]